MKSWNRVRLQQPFQANQSVPAGSCENGVGVFDLSPRTVMAAGSQTPKHNRRTDAEASQEPCGQNCGNKRRQAGKRVGPPARCLWSEPSWSELELSLPSGDLQQQNKAISAAFVPGRLLQPASLSAQDDPGSPPRPPQDICSFVFSRFIRLRRRYGRTRGGE